jgi:2-keto-3-deoxy-L-rhamnonate aldolase RhmA
MVPHVSTVEKAQELVQSVKFPPIGNRGIDAAGLDCDFSLPEHLEYVQEANDQTALVVQIETREAVENVEEIAALEGVDGLFIGPGDLGMRLALDESTDMTVESATERVAAAAAAHGKAWGRPAATEMMGPLFDQGARLLAHGGDFGAIMDHLRECGSHFDDLASRAAAD